MSRLSAFLFLASPLVAQNPIFFQTSYSPSTVSIPNFSPSAGTVSSGTTVTISVISPSGATICYTVDGSTPAANGAGVCTHGTTGSSVTINTPETIEAVGSKSGSSDSSVGSAAYTVASTMGIVQIAPTCGSYVSALSNFQCVFSSGLTAGDTVLLACTSAATSFAFGPSMTPLVTPTSGAPLVGMWLLQPSAGFTTETITNGAFKTTTCGMIEVTGIATSSIIDQFAGITYAYGTGGANVTGAVSTSNASDVILSLVAGTTGAGTITQGSGYTAIGTFTYPSTGSQIFLQYQRVSATATYNPGATWTTVETMYYGTVALEFQ
jgi:hypothetical protein